MDRSIKIAVIGYGYWGPNLVRNFRQLRDSNLVAVCDLERANLKRAKQAYPEVKATGDYREIINDPQIKAVVIATTGSTHYKLAKKSLLQNKHVFVEKPFVLKVKEGEELIDVARKKGKVLMVGHLLEYHPAVEKLKKYIKKGDLGKIYYIYSTRVNLGMIRKDENALWSFAPHDLSMILYLLGQEPIEVSATGETYLQEDVHDVAFVNLKFEDSIMAHLHLSWLDPHKIRKMTIVGTKKMAVFDDMEPSEKIKIYDKGVIKDYKDYGEALSIRSGDIHIPKVDMEEPLKLECRHFLDCILNGKKPRSNGQDGLRIVKILTAAQQSLDKGGVPVKIPVNE